MDHPENIHNKARQPSSILLTRVVPLMLALQILLTLLIYPFLPNTIPSHWNNGGQIDSYEAKWIYVSFMPIFSILLYLFVLGLFTFVINKKSNSQAMSAKKNDAARSLLMFMMIMQQSIFFITQVILLIVALHTGSGATH